MAYVFNTVIKVPVYKPPFVSGGKEKPRRDYVLPDKLRGSHRPKNV